MSRLDELPPDQRATLSLLLRRRKTYAEVAAMLAISEHAVHDRAHAALAVLAPREARELTPGQREEIGDYLLGQQASMAERLDTRSLIAASPQAQAWARAIAAELAPLADEPLPEIPQAAPAPGGRVGGARPSAPQRERPTAVQAQMGAHAGARMGARAGEEQLPSSRLGGAVLLVAAAAVIALVVILLTGGFDSASKHRASASHTTSSKTTTGPAVTKQIALTSPNTNSRSVGAVEILAEGSRRAFFIDAENLPESKGFFYLLWLYNSPSSFKALTKAPNVGSSHRLQGGALLPTQAGSYKTLLLTRESSHHPTHPGAVVLSGPWSLG